VNRDEAEELLPWYVAGTLSAEEMKAVQALIDSGEISAEQLEALKLVGVALAGTGADASRRDMQILQRLLDGLHDDPSPASLDEPLVVVRERSTERRDDDRPSGLPWSLTPRLAKALIGVQFALLLGLAAGLMVADDRDPAGYPVASTAVPGDYTVMFAPGVSEAQLRSLLLESRAHIVAGPSAIGLYTIDLDDGVAADAGPRLEASGLVAFVQRVR
jgi:hypothetical protein